VFWTPSTWLKGQYRPVRAGVSCAAVPCGGACAKRASRHGRGLAFGLFMNRDAGILSGGVGARPVLAYAGVSCALLCGGALWGARAKHASRHGRGLIFGLYLNRDAGILSRGVGARPVPACTCRRLLCVSALWGARAAKHASRHGRGLIFGLYLNRDAGILSEGVGARPVLACTCSGVSCAGVRCGVHVLSTHRDMIADQHSGCI
jgi:hypothetical protein